jgi:voltage-gated potassium channel
MAAASGDEGAGGRPADRRATVSAGPAAGMNSPLRQLQIGLSILAFIFVVGAAGYCVAGWSLLDSVYMVVITLSTVGYREVHDLDGSPGLKIFTILVIVFGVSTSLYIVGVLVRMMLEGEINKALGQRSAGRQIEHLAGHVVLCGYGRMGEVLAEELDRSGKPFVTIEKDPARVAEAAAHKYLVITDDATEEEALMQAGVDRAKTLVTTLPADTDNVFITLTARNLNPKLMIIARGEFKSTEKKLLQAGADRVVLPAAAGALRMAAMVIRPTAVELIEVVAGRQIAEVEVAELEIPERSPLVGATIRQIQPRARHGLLIVAVRRRGAPLEFNPGGDTVFEAGASIVVLGRSDAIDAFRAEFEV